MNFRVKAALATALFLVPGFSMAGEHPLVASRKAAMVEECKSFGNAGGKFGEKFATAIELNGDGVEDFVFDIGEAPCGSGFCGTAGCQQEFWLSTGSNFKKAYSDYLQGWTIIESKGKKIFVAAVHGGACGLSGADECNMQYSFKGQKIKPTRYKGKIDWDKVFGNQ